MSNTLRWSIVIVLMALVVAMVALARGQEGQQRGPTTATQAALLVPELG